MDFLAFSLQNRVRRVYSHRLRGAVYGPVSDAADRVRSAPRDRRRARLKRYPGWGAAIRSVGERLVARARLRQGEGGARGLPVASGRFAGNAGNYPRPAPLADPC